MILAMADDNFIEELLKYGPPALEDGKIQGAEVIEKLTSFLDELIRTDFGRLVQILYRVDIDETRLRIILRENPEKLAAELIAHLILERLSQKAKLRRQSGNTAMESDEELW